MVRAAKQRRNVAERRKTRLAHSVTALLLAVFTSIGVVSYNFIVERANALSMTKLVKCYWRSS